VLRVPAPLTRTIPSALLLRSGGPSRASAWLLLGLGLGLPLSACEFGLVEVVAPPPAEMVQVTLRFVPAEDDAPIQRLGWSEAVPGVTVTLDPVNGEASGTGGSSIRRVSDGAGVLQLEVPAGQYELRARRELSDSEWDAVSGLDLTLLSAVGTLLLDQPVIDRTVQLQPGRRGGLLISEWSHYKGYIPGGGGSYEPGYYEIYNNGDTTAYLDGIRLGSSVEIPRSLPHDRCIEGFSMYYDPNRLWAEIYGAFPGTGRDYPVAPGHIVIVAVNAVDHSEVWNMLPDLSRAEFEFVGDTDTDNPAAANMINLGRRAPGGNGYATWGTKPSFLAHPQTTPPPTRTTSWGIPYHGIPVDEVMDIFQPISAVNLAVQDKCSLEPHPLVRAPMNKGDYNDATLSGHRRVVRTLPDGRPVLQDTRDSSADFYPARNSPWRITLGPDQS
jgi:hypothetical protein